MGASLGNSGPKRGRRRAARQMAEINVTPMVDVMLVLLIIFMVAAPLLTAGVPVNLPKTKAASLNQNDTKPLEVSIDASGAVFIQKMPVDINDVATKLMAISNNNKDTKIYIRGDKNVDYGRVAKVMGAVSSAGFTKLMLISTSENAGSRE